VIPQAPTLILFMMGRNIPVLKPYTSHHLTKVELLPASIL